MTTPDQEIESYLDSSGTAGPKRLDVAIVFARSMLRELRDSAADWERTATALQKIKQRQQTDVAAAAALPHAADNVSCQWGPSRRPWLRRSGGGGGIRRR
jgi:hypothetical protein